MLRLTLCKNSCCPTVEIVDGQVIIKDDFEGKVNLTLEQLKILVDNYSAIEESIK